MGLITAKELQGISKPVKKAREKSAAEQWITTFLQEAVKAAKNGETSLTTEKELNAHEIEILKRLGYKVEKLLPNFGDENCEEYLVSW